MALVGRIVQKQERDTIKGSTIHKTIQKIHKIERKYKTNIKVILKNMSRVIRK